jgi:hypothetical protein
VKQYIVDGTILFIREATGNKLNCLRIPSFKGDGTADVSTTIPDPVIVEIDEYRLRPATEAEYREWQSLGDFERSHRTTVWPSGWGGHTEEGDHRVPIFGVTVDWLFDWQQFPNERTPDVRHTSFGRR